MSALTQGGSGLTSPSCPDTCTTAIELSLRHAGVSPSPSCWPGPVTMAGVPGSAGTGGYGLLVFLKKQELIF